MPQREFFQQRAAQNWYPFGTGEPFVMANADLSYEVTSYLSSDKGTKELVIVATPGGGEPGNGNGASPGLAPSN
jgi:hypothetical protein